MRRFVLAVAGAAVGTTVLIGLKGPFDGPDDRVTGTVVQTRYGPVQVEVVRTDGKITDVRAIQLPDGDADSRALSQRAAPLLRTQALTKQNAELDVVSGATYTSEGYRKSLQAALDLG